MVVLGHPNTTHVTLEDMEHHVRAAARAKPRALLAADLPYRTYETPEQAVASARRLCAAGAEAVKAEGGREILHQVEAIRGAGIPFVGHLGMLPQHVLEEGGYRIKGRDEVQRQALLADAVALEAAGAIALVLELVTPPVAAELSRAIGIPTIGIGSGPDCDGQILAGLGFDRDLSLVHAQVCASSDGRGGADAERGARVDGRDWRLKQRKRRSRGSGVEIQDREVRSGDGDVAVQVHVLDEVEQLDAFLHRRRTPCGPR